MSTNTNPVIGVVLLARHGDRQGFYQNPNTYAASNTAITPLGEQQLFQVGTMLRSIYANQSSERTVFGLNTTALVASQINSTADGGGEGGVIFDSAVALWQGFYPPNPNVTSETLANGTIVTSPLNGYQTLQIDAVLPSDDVDFESWVNCGTWMNRTNSLYNTTEFQARAAQATPFLQKLKDDGLVGNRTVSLSNAYNLYDFVNVQRIHNATFNQTLVASGTDTLGQLRALSDYQQYLSFTDSTDGGLGNIAGRTLIPRILDSLQQFANDSEIKVAHYQASYKPFLSLFNMTDVAAAGLPGAQSMVDYGSIATFELRQSMTNSSAFEVRFGFRNGSFDGTVPFDFTYYPLFGQSSLDYPLSSFYTQLNSSLIFDNPSWCQICNNSINSGCAAVALSNSYKELSQRLESESHFSPVGAGFIGFALTAVTGALVLFGMMKLGYVSFGRKSRRHGESYPLNYGKASSIASSRI